MNYGYYLKRFWPLYLITVILCIAAAAGADQAVTTIAEQMPVARSVTFVIDAGHGGEDGGATSCTGLLESEMNLQIALRLRDLCYLMGYRTKMIRTEDVSVYTEGKSLSAKKVSDLRQRVRLVDDTENGILISIHQNTFPIGKYSGAQVFYNDLPGAKSLAEGLQRTFVQTINQGSNRKCKASDGIFLLDKISRPGVLIECGFISNPKEESLLRSEAYQQKLCCVIVSALGSYLNT